MTAGVKEFITNRYEKDWFELMGRPRGFDPEKSLDAALGVFWRKGYEGTSYTDLTQAIGVEKPAIYSAYGNKESLFRKVLQRYYDHYQGYLPEALALPTAHEVVARILEGSIDLNTRYPEHRGCLVINGCLAASDDAEPVRNALIEARMQAHALILSRFERARDEGDLPETSSPEALTTLLTALLHGLAVQAKAGFSADQLRAAANAAMASWPLPQR